MNKFLPRFIHASHAAWMIAIVLSVDKSGAIVSYSLFVPPFVLASVLEICRWWLLGRESVEITGSYALGTNLEAIHREFVSFSWYVIPPLPPMKLFERYSEGNHKFPIIAQRSQVLAKFYLTSELTMPLIACIGLLLMNAYPGSAPRFYGLGKYHSMACLFWIMGFGLLSKMLSIYVFSVLIRLTKGF